METVAEPPGTLPRAQEPLRSQSEARNSNDSPACKCVNIIKHIGLNAPGLGPLLLTWLPTWINNHMPIIVLDEITYPFPNFKGYTVDV